jgi:hypothetical protein
MRSIRSRIFTSVVAVAFSAAAAAGPIGWMREKLGGKSEPPKPGVVTAQPGAITLLLDQPTRLPVDASAPEAELPRGRSYFRRVELSKPVDEALIQVRVIAQDSDTTKHRTVFKPLFYLLDDEGNVRETIAVDPLKIDIRPFQPTALVGCVKVNKLSRFLVATTDKDVGKSYESDARSSVKAPSKGGFYYSTDAVNVKLPYAATGELVLTVSAPAAKLCDPVVVQADKKDEKSDDKDASAKRAAAN